MSSWTAADRSFRAQRSTGAHVRALRPEDAGSRSPADHPGWSGTTVRPCEVTLDAGALRSCHHLSWEAGTFWTLVTTVLPFTTRVVVVVVTPDALVVATE